MNRAQLSELKELEKEDLSPSQRHRCLEAVREHSASPSAGACSMLDRRRSTLRKSPEGREHKEQLTANVIELARQYVRHGHRRIDPLLTSLVTASLGGEHPHQKPHPIEDDGGR